MSRHYPSDLAGAIHDMSREDAAVDARMDREAAAARRRAEREEPPDDEAVDEAEVAS